MEHEHRHPMTEPWWTPERHAGKRARLLTRNRIVAALRAQFDADGFIEVETPALQISPGLEPHLHAFETRLERPNGSGTARYLHTSPEFAMKKLLAAGESRIVQFARVWRNRERSATHHPEFTMLEWYRAGATYDAVIEDCVAILRLAAEVAGARGFTRGAMACDPFAPWARLTVADAFDRYAGIDLLATAPNPLNPDVALLARAADAAGVPPHDGDRWDDVFFRVLFERIEPFLGDGAPTVLMEYPVSMAALARPKPRDPRVAERFEVYAVGVELANGFGELTDAAIQRQRFEADLDLKQALYGVRYPIDEDFLAALAHGLPDCAGCALGLDRLVMLATGAERIDDVLWAPVDSET
jgi:elongation factor P--(R)-beta-lysine ligase